MGAYLVRVSALDLPGLGSVEGILQLIQSTERPSRQLNLDDAWAVLHFLMSGDVPMPEPDARERGLSWDESSMQNVLMGGIETLYRTTLGAARYLEPERVIRVSERLTSLTPAELLRRYDVGALASEGIPPGDWVDDEDTRRWIRRHYVALVDFYQTAASSEDGLLVCVV